MSYYYRLLRILLKVSRHSLGTPDASLERRRRWAASGRLPPSITACFTLAEQAVLALVAAETARRNDCRLPERGPSMNLDQLRRRLDRFEAIYAPKAPMPCAVIYARSDEDAARKLTSVNPRHPRIVIRCPAKETPA
jgi:hypothetical protein